MNKVFDRVFKSCENNEDRDYCEILRKEYIEIIDILKKAENKKEKLINISTKSINDNIKKLYNIKETDGFVKFGTEVDEKKILSSKYENTISIKDAETLVDSYALMIEALNNRWIKIVDEYIKQKREYVMLTTFEDAETLIDFELCMLKYALDIMYKTKDEIKNEIPKENLKEIEEFLGKYRDVKENKVIDKLKEIKSISKNDH